MNETGTNVAAERFGRGRTASPDGDALRTADTTITYREMHETALRWAAALPQGRPGAPTVVGVLAGKTAPAYLGLLAALYSGATVVPLNPDFPAARLRQMLTLARVSALVVDDIGRERLPGILDGGEPLPVLDPARPPAGPGLAAPRPVCPVDAAYVLFTSGSTGNPKGVPISHASIAHYFGLLDQRYDFTPADVFSQTFDLNFDCAMFDLFCAWGAGATVQTIPPHEYRDLPRFLAEKRVTVWFSTPSAIALVRRLGGLGPGSMPGLRWSFFAGEALNCHDVEDWLAAAEKSTVENLYGPTELTVTITGYRWTPSTPEIAVNGLVPIGAMHPGHEHLLLGDGDVADDVEGELCITGPQLTTGYLDPADDRGRFLDRDGARWYRTGDRVRLLPGGVLTYLGRLDNQVQVQGWRVELAEVDHALRSGTGVQDAVTVAVPVDGSTELVSFYTGEPVAASELARRLRDFLPHGMIPKAFVNVSEFPLNANRKVDRRALADIAARR